MHRLGKVNRMLITQKSYPKALIIHDEGFILFYLYLFAI